MTGAPSAGLCLCLAASFDDDLGIALDEKCSRCGHLGADHYRVVADGADSYCPTACRAEVLA